MDKELFRGLSNKLPLFSSYLQEEGINCNNVNPSLYQSSNFLAGFAVEVLFLSKQVQALPYFSLKDNVSSIITDNGTTYL